MFGFGKAYRHYAEVSTAPTSEASALTAVAGEFTMAGSLDPTRIWPANSGRVLTLKSSDSHTRI
jgi:hypothetical protein